MATVDRQLLTADEFWLLPEGRAQRALVRGEVRETMPPGARHGMIAVVLAALLRAWARGGPGGCVGVESGFVLARSPDTVRGPDVFYVRPERVPPGGVPEGFWPIAPDLAAEVVSPDEGPDEVRDYLAAGTRLVLAIYPRAREVVAHTPDGQARRLGAGDTIEAPDILPGFTCPVRELFDEMD